MNSNSSISAIEFQSIPRGMLALDRMVKKAPIWQLKSGIISNGRFLILFSGTTASVEAAFHEGISVGDDKVLDSVFLPHPHSNLLSGLLGERLNPVDKSIMVMEAESVCTLISSVDASLKGTDTELLDIRLADDLLHGKAVAVLQGYLQETQAARDIFLEIMNQRSVEHQIEIIPAPHIDVYTQIKDSLRFLESSWLDIKGEEPL